MRATRKGMSRVADANRIAEILQSCEARLQRVDDHLQAMGDRLDGIDDRLQTRFSLADARFDVIRIHFQSIHIRLREIDRWYRLIGDRLADIRIHPEEAEHQIDQMAPLFDEIDGSLQVVDRMLSQIEAQLSAVRRPFLRDNPNPFEVVFSDIWSLN